MNVSTLDADLLFKFFFAFSRFEYALKRAGYIQAKQSKNPEKHPDAFPDWDAFASLHESHFESALTPELQMACDYMFKYPPRKQIVVESALQWSEQTDVGNASKLTWMLCMVRRVRNNLFHGGKYPFKVVSEAARNKELLNHSLTILRASLQLDHEVRSYFESDEE